MQRRRLIIAATAALLGTHREALAETRLGSLVIGAAWALPVRISREGQAFVPLLNAGKEQEELVAARSSVCGAIELRRNNRYDDPPQQSFILPPGEPFGMAPTARHLRLMGLAGPLAQGQRFTIILDFLNAGEAEVAFRVEARG